MFSDEVLRTAHKSSSNHEDLMRQSTLCGCFYCLRIFPTTEIGTDVGKWEDANGNPVSLFDRFWRDGKRWDGWIKRKKDNHLTAVCPYCCVDSLIPEKAGYPLTEQFLKAMHQIWFGRVSR